MCIRDRNGVVTQRANLVDAVVGGSVDLQNIQAGTGIDGTTSGAFVAGIAVLRPLTVDGLGQNLCTGSLAGAAAAGKQICMAQLAGGELPLERLRDTRLPDHIVKGLRTVFPIEHLIHTFAS